MKQPISLIALALLSAALLPLTATATDGEQLKADHRAAAQAYLDTIAPGLVMHGSVKRNNSTGHFDAYHFGDSWLVRQDFGPIEWLGYSGEEGSWSGSNYGLPYEVTPSDSPANAVMELLTSGDYLTEQYWQYFNYVSEDAGGYNFSFTPPDLPPVKVVLYGDPQDPYYLQMMSLELKLAPHDDKSVTYRTFYYYDVDDQGRLITTRETSREINDQGETNNFVEYDVEDTQWPDTRPPELTFDFARNPFSKSAAALTAPVTIPTSTDNGYFMVPMTFAGDTETYWFILDTGASASLFSPTAAEAAGLEPVLDLPTYGHGSSVEMSLGMCSTASLGKVGGEQAPLDGFVATLVPEDNELLQVFQTYGASGLLSIAPLHQYVTTFDQPNGTITLTPPELFDSEQVLTPHTYVMDLDVEDLAFCPARINDTLDGQVVIDTGLALPQDLALMRETMEYNDVEMTDLTQHDSAVLGGVRSFQYVSIPSFEVLTSHIPENHGPLKMSNTVASLSEDDHGSLSGRGLLGFVGMTMFIDVKVTIDLFGQKLYYEVPEHMIRTDEPEALQAEIGEQWPPAEEQAPPEDEHKTELPVNID
jgi:hypothetical protein